MGSMHLLPWGQRDRKGGARCQHGVEVACQLLLVNALEQVAKALDPGQRGAAGLRGK